NLGTLLWEQGRLDEALAAILRALSIAETANAKRIFLDIAKKMRWRGDNPAARVALARALIEPWARPAELAATPPRLFMQNEKIGAGVRRATQAWPHGSVTELFGAGGPTIFADGLLMALLTSAQNTDVELERFLTLARRTLLEAADAPSSSSEAVGHENDT